MHLLKLLSISHGGLLSITPEFPLENSLLTLVHRLQSFLQSSTDSRDFNSQAICFALKVATHSYEAWIFGLENPQLSRSKQPIQIRL